MSAPISGVMAGLLWRRVHEARANADSHVPPMLADTLGTLLRQADVPDPAETCDCGPDRFSAAACPKCGRYW